MANKAEMEKFMLEAAKIESMTNSEGWQILRGYLDNTIKVSHDAWLYAPAKSPKLEELRNEARIAHSMIDLVENFKQEGQRLFKLWAKAQGLIPEAPLDIDNESPNVEEED